MKIAALDRCEPEEIRAQDRRGNAALLLEAQRGLGAHTSHAALDVADHCDGHAEQRGKLGPGETTCESKLSKGVHDDSVHCYLR